MASEALRSLSGSGINQKTCPKPKPKPISAQSVTLAHQIKSPTRIHPCTKKLNLLSFLYHHMIPFTNSNNTLSSWPPTQDEVAALFQIPQSTIRNWSKYEGWILATKVGGRSLILVDMCRWPELKVAVNAEFMVEQEAGGAVRIGWFRRTLMRNLLIVYPAAPPNSFNFSNGWFHNFLQCYHISLCFATSKAQKVPEMYRLILTWICFNRRNSQPILNLFLDLILSSPNSYGKFYLSNIANRNETPLPMEYLSGRTYNSTGAKTV